MQLYCPNNETEQNDRTDYVSSIFRLMFMFLNLSE